LEQFSIYRPHKFIKWVAGKKPLEEKALSNEFISLHRINQQGEKLWYMDGILCYDGKRRYVHKVPFKILSIGGYEDRGLHTIGPEIWIQSVRGRNSGVWYRLRSPAPEYQRFHRPFLWVADLAKHVIDFMKEHNSISIFHFRSQFFAWLGAAHGSSDIFQCWRSKYSDTDFRRAIACHAGFLYFQAMQLDRKYDQHPLWAETDAEALSAVPEQRNNFREPSTSKSTSAVTKTVVTPYVFRCFEHLPFARFLDPQIPTPAVLRARNLKEIGNEVPRPTVKQNEKAIGRDLAGLTQVSIGDVIAIKAEKESSWKHNDQLWYGYVQGIQDTQKGRSLKILWLYRPTDTACQKMKYPVSNELFLSDHCNCNDHEIWASEVVLKPQVAFFAGPHTDAEFFVRQKYVGNDAAWVTLQKSDFECSCKANSTPREYSIGETLLVAACHAGKDRVLEAVEVVEKALLGDEGHLRVRRLLRRNRDYGEEDAEPNELVYTDILDVVPMKDVFRSCNVRFYTIEDKRQRRIPSQYRRGGTGDLYYIMYHHASTGLVPLAEPWPISMKQGWNPIKATLKMMRGLDIFCGGGNLGRGLEEGGAVKFDWAVDYFKEAIHTYRANLKHPGDAKLFCGSVNDYLSQAMRGTGVALVAQAGAVDVISAGSPCQGFSNANHWRKSDQALLNVSMVASVVSFVDFYRPKYALLENVTAMAKCNAKDSDSNVFAQVLGALVGMGYQVRSFILDSWNYGSPQSRTRLFISIAAPGLVPLPDPPQSHSHPEKVIARSLGKSANGLTLANRYWNLTPFRHVNIGEATKDLPLNFEGRIDSISFPDHRPSRHMSTVNRVRISCIPRFPPGQNFVKASMLGLMPPPQMEAYNWNAEARSRPEGRAWKRVDQNGLVATVTTTCQPEDGLCGAWVHWEACRCMTIMEVRRAQGFPDEEVIVGMPSCQWKIVGNSVARPVAFALGLALRSAWLNNCKELGSIPLLSQSDSIVSSTSKARIGPCRRGEVIDLSKTGPNNSGYKPTQNLPTKPNLHINSITRSSITTTTTTTKTTTNDLIFISAHKRTISLSSEQTPDDRHRKRQRYNSQPTASHFAASTLECITPPDSQGESSLSTGQSSRSTT
jgi:DNA (cytosine-5)-methyltransferase 1